jgi:large subunit ribosomal protein L15
MPLYRRLAQRGFSNHPFKKEWQIVNLVEIEKRYETGEIVNMASLHKKGLIKGLEPVKILSMGDITKKISFRVAGVSAAARLKIEKAGGDIKLNPPVPKARPKKNVKKTGGKK